jgi:DNA-binding NarL/FixJ family response regulator
VLPSDCLSADQVADAAPDGLAPKLQSLTQQQLRVLQMLCQGLPNKQIAHELDVGEATVKAHISEILRKLHVSSRTQAVLEVSKLDFGAVLELYSAETPNGAPHNSHRVN